MSSQTSQNHLNEAPQEYVESSIGEMIRNAAKTLESECSIIEEETERKSVATKELYDNIAKQTENIAKQSIEQEHLKALIQKEVMNKEAINDKNSAVREKYSGLEKHFSNLSKGINLALLAKDQLLQVLQKNIIFVDDGKKLYLEAEQKYNRAVEEAEKFFYTIEEQRDVERQEFSAITEHMLAQQCKLIDQEKENEAKLRDLYSVIREKNMSVNMLKSRNTELESAFGGLKSALSIEVGEVNSVVNHLQAKLQDQLAKKEKLIENLEELDTMIYSTNNTINKEEAEIDKSDRRHKELICKEEEYTKILEDEKHSFTDLKLQAESMKEKLNKLLKVYEENSKLKFNCEQLEETHKNFKNKAIEMENIEKSYIAQIKENNLQIASLEYDRETIINERQAISNESRNLLIKVEEDKKNYEHESTVSDIPYIESTEKNLSLNQILQSLALQLKVENESKENFDKTIKNLTEELEQAKVLSGKSESKLFSLKSDLTRIETGWDENRIILEEAIANTKLKYSKAQEDVVLYENTKEETKQLEVQIESNHVSIEKFLENICASYNNMLESKSHQMADLRMQFEREYRNKEQTKTDALVELKENKSRIEDLIKQKGMIKNEIERVQSNLMKCENLVHKLESKLKVVAHVATEDHSQPVSGTSTKKSNLLETYKNARQNAPGFQSPGSDSSAMTVDPYDVKYQLPSKRISSFNKKKKASKEKKASPDLDDWGF